MQRHAAKPVEREPACDGPLTSGQQKADAGRQRWDEHLAQPGIHEPEDLVVIERERDRRRETPQVPCKLGDVLEPADGPEETALGRFDGSAVELDHTRPAFTRALDEGAQHARLAHPGDPVQADHLRLAAQELLHGPKLRFSTDERDAAPLGDRRGDDRSITARPPRCKGRHGHARQPRPAAAAHLPLIGRPKMRDRIDAADFAR
jgi:hypothetical protein